MGKNVVVIGTQWGDEGKGKVVDWLTEHAQGVVRFQGGHNAGHTLVIGDKEVETDQVSVRTFGADKAKMETLSFDAFAQRVAHEARFP